MGDSTEEFEVYFQSMGALTGQYLPSQDDFAVGTLITSRGIFPTNLTPRLAKFLQYYPWMITTNIKYLCWVKGIDTEPYYLLKLKKTTMKYPPWIKSSGRFRFRGIVKEFKEKEAVIFVRRNHRSNVNEEQMRDSRTYIRIKDCPIGMKKGDFWRLETRLQQGELNCYEAHFLADAEETQKILAQQKKLYLQRMQRERLRLI